MFHPILSRNRALLILESRTFAMAFQVFMSFDLHNASEEDYAKFYNALAKIGLSHWVKGNIGKLELVWSKAKLFRICSPALRCGSAQSVTEVACW